jgi:hypothetical protein
MTVSEMSKIGPDADWKLRWEVWKGSADRKIIHMNISDFKAEDFFISEEDKGYALDTMTHAYFGSVLLADEVWKRRSDGEGYLKIDRKIVWEWKGAD